MWRADQAPRDEDIQLVESFAAQAAIAIENVRQFRELQTRLAREAATRNILRVISESPFDEQPTFEAILDSATQLCGTQYASLVRGSRRDTLQRMVAHRGSASETVALYREGKVPMDPEDSIGARAILEGRTIHVPDMADTFLAVPLIHKGKVIGNIAAYKRVVKPFSQQDIDLLQNFADQAVIAIQNVRLLRETKDALERQTATAEVLDVISNSVEVAQPVFEKTLDSCQRLIPCRDLSILTLDDEGLAHLEAVRGPVGTYSARHYAPLPVDRTIIASAIESGRLEHFTDVIANPETPAVIRRLAERSGNFSCLIAPMVWKGKAAGALFIARAFEGVATTFSHREIDILESFADQAAIAVQNARLCVRRNRHCAVVLRSGGDRHRKRTPVQRNAERAGASDRHPRQRRCAAEHHQRDPRLLQDRGRPDGHREPSFRPARVRRGYA